MVKLVAIPRPLPYKPPDTKQSSILPLPYKGLTEKTSSVVSSFPLFLPLFNPSSIELLTASVSLQTFARLKTKGVFV